MFRPPAERRGWARSGRPTESRQGAFPPRAAGTKRRTSSTSCPDACQRSKKENRLIDSLRHLERDWRIYRKHLDNCHPRSQRPPNLFMIIGRCAILLSQSNPTSARPMTASALSPSAAGPRQAVRALDAPHVVDFVDDSAAASSAGLDIA